MENGGIYSDRADREVWQAMGVVMGRWRVHFLVGGVKVNSICQLDWARVCPGDS